MTRSLTHLKYQRLIFRRGTDINLDVDGYSGTRCRQNQDIRQPSYSPLHPDYLQSLIHHFNFLSVHHEAHLHRPPGLKVRHTSSPP
jgi:hypothetical protein